MRSSDVTHNPVASIDSPRRIPHFSPKKTKKGEKVITYVGNPLVAASVPVPGTISASIEMEMTNIEPRKTSSLPRPSVKSPGTKYNVNPLSSSVQADSNSDYLLPQKLGISSTSGMANPIYERKVLPYQRYLPVAFTVAFMGFMLLFVTVTTRVMLDAKEFGRKP